jgi:hypothetical protein
MNGTHLLNSLSARFLLRDAETRARRLNDLARRDFATQLVLAKQKLDSAQVLWAHQQYVEALRLAEECVTETLRAAELGVHILPSAAPDPASAQPVWAQVLLELGNSPQQIQDALLCQNGLPGARSILNSQISAEERGYFQKAIQVAYQALEQLRPAVRSPRDIVFSRWGRVATVAAGFLLVVGLALATFKYSRTAKTQEVSMRERSMQDGFLFREDGSQAVHVVQGGTRFLIPTAKEFTELGYQWHNVQVVPPGSMAHLRNKPADRALVKERATSTVFLYEAGKKRPIMSEDAFRRGGYKWSNVKTVPTGSLGNDPAGKPIE